MEQYIVATIVDRKIKASITNERIKGSFCYEMDDNPDVKRKVCEDIFQELIERGLTASQADYAVGEWHYECKKLLGLDRDVWIAATLQGNYLGPIAGDKITANSRFQAMHNGSFFMINIMARVDELNDYSERMTDWIDQSDLCLLKKWWIFFKLRRQIVRMFG